MKWTQFDADKPNQKLIDDIKALGREFLLQLPDKTTTIKDVIRHFNDGRKAELTKVIGIDIFRPSEFASLTENDDSLLEFRDWLLEQSIDWESGSKTLQKKIDKKYEAIGSKKISGGREIVILDNLVNVGGKRVAIEIETSKNFDNGYFTLKQAVKENIADYGVMIVPWIEIKSGRVNEGKALGRLDREFDNKKDLQEGPIFRIAPIRIIDSLKTIENE